MTPDAFTLVLVLNVCVSLKALEEGKHIYEGRKVVCLFCFALLCTDEIHRTGMLQITFLVSLESS
jgi:hypothetical protein